MGRFISYLSTVILLALILAGGFLIHFSFGSETLLKSVSPIPDFLTLSKNSQVRLLDLWLPSLDQNHGSVLGLSALTARSILIYDLVSDEVIYEKNADKRMPMASLTKIMTAIIAIENPRKENEYAVKEENLVGENSMGLSEGEVLSLEELLYGLMLPSGNDAAETLAGNYPSGRVAFIQAMNDKAKALGLKDTHFDNPSGLQGDGIQYTTAHDLLVMTRYALESYPLFAQIVSTVSYVIPATFTHKGYEVANETNLLTTYEGVKGVKTGYTPEAGLCLVTYLDYGRHKIIGVLLNSENRRGEMRELLDYSLTSLGIKPPPFQGD